MRAQGMPPNLKHTIITCPKVRHLNQTYGYIEAYIEVDMQSSDFGLRSYVEMRLSSAGL